MERRKRFFGDVILDDGTSVVAHVANSGAMTGVATPGSVVWLSAAQNPARTLAWDWQLTEEDGVPVGVNTARANDLAALLLAPSASSLSAAALSGTALAMAPGYSTLRREWRHGDSRFDFRLDGHFDDPRPLVVEVKSVSLSHVTAQGRGGRFPDARTTRGEKHLNGLIALRTEGFRAMLLFVGRRGDLVDIRPAADVDPAYARALARAEAAGVELRAVAVAATPEGETPLRSIPVRVLEE